MVRHTSILGLAVALVAWATITAPAEIISVSGSVSAEIQAIESGHARDTETASDTALAGSDQLPLQVVARLVDEEGESAGAAAAQFADPFTATGSNPEEFALNLTLSSLAADRYYTAQAESVEQREVVFSAAELATGLTGQTATLTGKFFIDGALAVFSTPTVTDLSHVSVVLRVKIRKEIDGQEPQVILDGSLELSGDADGELSVTATGDFPTAGVTDNDLADIDPELDVFRVIVVPGLAVEYSYDVTVGQPFTLWAKVYVEATNQPVGVGVAAIVGTPIDTLDEVFAATLDEDLAKTMTTALQRERANPAGGPAFAAALDQLARDSGQGDVEVPLSPFCVLCGWCSFEMALALLGLVGLRVASPYRRLAARR